MSGVQIALLFAGVIIFMIGSFLPGRKNKRAISEDTDRITEEQIQFMVEKEIDNAKQHIKEIVDETISYTMEKSERAMERITNEKMLAVNEYSDTVLGEIHKNHQEVVFLYDMLNDKHEMLKGVVSQMTMTANEVQQTIKDAERADSQEQAFPSFTALQPMGAEMPEEASTIHLPKKKRGTGVKKQEAAAGEEMVKENSSGAGQEISLPFEDGRGGSRNNNERILELHREGKSNMVIARELGLGIGEVKLVIDLFEGAGN